MIEIRFHGRYGQPVAALAGKVAQAALAAGKYVQVFENFGAYRPGAPMYAVVRIDNNFIRERSANASSPDAVVVLDNSLLAVTDVTKGLQDGGMVLAMGIGPEALGEKGKKFKFTPVAPAGDKQQALLATLEGFWRDQG
ncbi:2-oxoacid:acceptor oxidoreductase, gamma subunit,pyruvate/2-ketoisovalerate [Moorella glycerini]|uniref:Pyruvate synthase subunit PorC n=1 Tax=Neomoorella stamsii TaxID=1266720 RepID=A0A9X7J1Q2_9FIRM|nr:MULTISPECIES: 2-oxoacid:acceptor oxidoreductase family protein [Moorella]PRR69948.1 Pyruvate synthase subunit PorC [Moorella stamsii]CEP68501.1 2-oxoacid:acceptor oxidoreductase, gamma subunit,pyruvate/2-ketoisovalerate [Moorella glycerini]